jgi:hypothetical protein
VVQSLVNSEQILALFARLPVCQHDIGDTGIGQAGVVIEWRQPGDGDDALDPRHRAGTIGSSFNRAIKRTPAAYPAAAAAV